MSATQLRSMLSQALLDAGPDAPTLCEGWRTRHLAAHLVLREHETWRMAGLLIPSQRIKVEALTITTGDAAATPVAYERLVGRFAAGPSALSPWYALDGLANVLEYAVHLEDVVRPAGLHPVDYPREVLDDVWRKFSGRARLMFRRDNARIALVADEQDGGQRLAIGKRNNSLPLLVVRGRLMDLVLLTFGRPADCRITGPDDAVAAFRATRRYI